MKEVNKLGIDESRRNVIDLLDAIEQMVKDGKSSFFSDRVSIESKELLQFIDLIRASLPEDILQAKWIKEEKESIIAQARSDYEMIIRGAEQEANNKISEHAITEEAKLLASHMYSEAERYHRDKKLQTYDYIEAQFNQFSDTLNEIKQKYVAEMIEQLDLSFKKMDQIMEQNIVRIRELAEKTLTEPIDDHKISIRYRGDE